MFSEYIRLTLTSALLMIFVGFLTLARADDAVANAQQTLKDQGFYYGAITGEKNADTTAAIRRYQIRNGLQVTGELDTETLRALETDSSKAEQPASRNMVSPPPSAPRDIVSPPPSSPETDDTLRDSEAESGAPVQPFDGGQYNGRPPIDAHWNRFRERQEPPSSFSPPGPAIVPPGGGLFAGTPYETAPPELQHDVVASAQSILVRKNLYQGEVDGIFGPNTEFSLRAYQSRVGLPVTGRLDLETLAALDLLPGRHLPIFTPRRPIVRPRSEEPVRGEWIHE